MTYEKYQSTDYLTKLFPSICDRNTVYKQILCYILKYYVLKYRFSRWALILYISKKLQGTELFILLANNYGFLIQVYTFLQKN